MIINPKCVGMIYEFARMLGCLPLQTPRFGVLLSPIKVNLGLGHPPLRGHEHVACIWLVLAET